MPDNADVAATLQDDHTAAGLRRIDAAMPAGAPGDCEECGETMPRLVAGRCGFCRDGRRPPADRYAAIQARHLSPPQEKPMPTPTPTAHAQTISVPATGEELAAIRARATERDLPLGRAALSLIGDHLRNVPAPTEDAGPASIGLADVHLDALLDELRRRFERAAGDSAAVTAAIARAELAEGKLALMGGILSGHVVPAGTEQ